MKNIISIAVLIFQLFFTYTVFAQNIGNGELSELKREYNSFTLNDSGIICWNDVRILFTMEYQGGLPPADMLFLSNSIMILKSNFFSNEMQVRENRFFRYSLNDNILKILFIDSRVDSSAWFDVTFYHINDRRHGILSIDEIEKSITHDLSRNRILFGGVYFFLD